MEFTYMCKYMTIWLNSENYIISASWTTERHSVLLVVYYCEDSCHTCYRENELILSKYELDNFNHLPAEGLSQWVRLNRLFLIDSDVLHASAVTNTHKAGA